MARDKQMNLRLGEDEIRMFDALADHYGLSIASMLRMLVKRDVVAHGIKVGKPAKRAAKKGG